MFFLWPWKSFEHWALHLYQFVCFLVHVNLTPPGPRAPLAWNNVRANWRMKKLTALSKFLHVNKWLQVGRLLWKRLVQWLRRCRTCSRTRRTGVCLSFSLYLLALWSLLSPFVHTNWTIRTNSVIHLVSLVLTDSTLIMFATGQLLCRITLKYSFVPLYFSQSNNHLISLRWSKVANVVQIPSKSSTPVCLPSQISFLRFTDTAEMLLFSFYFGGGGHT